MDLFDGSESFASRRPASPVVAIGIFDGVHLGHRELMRAARMEASRRDGTAVAYTFEPHPVKLLSPEQCPKLLTTKAQKLIQFSKAGLDAAIIEPFTPEFARQAPKRFFDEIVKKRLGASCVVIGYDFTFGQHRQGTIETFEEMGLTCDVSVKVVPAVFAGETLISSTVIRSMIADGEVRRARSLLGRIYEVVGKVVPGRGFGATLDARTANIELESELMPKDGVYVTRTLIHPAGYGAGDPIAYASVTSIGFNPTFANLPHTFETHLIDTQAEIQGSVVSVEFLEYMRGQERFQTVDELRRRIHEDIDAAREFHRREGR